jgi:hypothetical protein
VNLVALMYGLKPVPFSAFKLGHVALMCGLKPVPFSAFKLGHA